MRYWGCFAVLALVLLPSSSGLTAERTWTDVKGRQMRAEFLREAGGTVTFLKDGKPVDFPLADLSERDQQAVRDLAAGKPVADEPSPAPTSNPALPAAAVPSEPAAEAGTGVKKPIPFVNRVWTDKFGNQSQARFVRMFGNGVVLAKTNKQSVTVAFYELTSEDQDYVRELLASRGQEALIPPPPPPPPVESPPSPPSPPSFSPPSFPRPSFSPPPFQGGGSSFAEAARQRAEESRQRMEQLQQESRQRMEQQRQEQAQRDAERAQKRQEDLERSRQELEAARQNETVGECLSCKGKLTRAQTEQGTCPHCGVNWQFEVDAFGHRKPIFHATSGSGASGGNAVGGNAPKLDPATIAQARKIFVIGVVVVGVLGMFAVVVFVAITIAAAGSAKSRQKFY